MAQFKAFSSSVEVNGETVLSVVNGVGAFKRQALDILIRNGINDPKAGQWYPQQSWLNAFKEIAEKIGPKSLFSIGKAIPANANFPPDINTIEKALSSIDVAYHMNHKGGEIGHYKFVKTEGNTGKMICNNPYPCEFDMGIIEAMAQKFKPADSVMAFVEQDDSQPCRKKGAESCTYLITW
ncbi:MAG TPA: hypothetical protein VF941_07145 [Clostridia bacterium]